MSPEVAPRSMKMSDSPLLKGAKALGLGGCLVGIWPRWLTGQPPKLSAFLPLFKGGFQKNYIFKRRL